MYCAAHYEAYTATLLTKLITDKCAYQPHEGPMSKISKVLLKTKQKSIKCVSRGAKPLGFSFDVLTKWLVKMQLNHN